MNIPRFVITFLAFVLIPVPLHSWQGSTPQGALEEIATTNKPEILVRHLPETIQKSIEALPKPKKSEVMMQLMQMKADQFDYCTFRRAEGADAWEILDKDGERKGTVKLENAYISGLDALLPLQISSADNSGTLIVTLHLEDNEWRIGEFGNWSKSDAGLAKLLHEPTEIEQNEEAARNALARINGALARYANSHPRTGYPSGLKPLTVPSRQTRLELWLEESFAAEPLIISGYEFRYFLTLPGNGKDDPGQYELRASPLEFGKTGVKSFVLSAFSGLRSTSENRPATLEDGRDADDQSAILVD
jgi:hypothetical protein